MRSAVGRGSKKRKIKFHTKKKSLKSCLRDNRRERQQEFQKNFFKGERKGSAETKRTERQNLLRTGKGKSRGSRGLGKGTIFYPEGKKGSGFSSKGGGGGGRIFGQEGRGRQPSYIVESERRHHFDFGGGKMRFPLMGNIAYISKTGEEAFLHH